MALTTTTAQGSAGQNASQSPQTATSTNNTVAAGNVQPGTAPSLLNQSNGTPLQLRTLPAANLNIQSTAQVTAPAVPKDQISPAAFILPAVLLVIAIVLFWLSGRADKSTTDSDK
jgi:cobalamin biosynthesis Mg chelatase CobN